MTRADKCLALGILLLAVLSAAAGWYRFSLSRTSSAGAVIKAEGKIVRRIDLTHRGGHATFSIPGRLGPATVEVAGGRIRIVEAPCPGRICIHRGWIEKPGEAIACIPGEILIQVEGSAAVDAVTR